MPNSTTTPIIKGSLALMKCVMKTCQSPLHAIILLELANAPDGMMTPAALNTELDGIGLHDVIEDLIDHKLIADVIVAYQLMPAGEIEVMAMAGSVMLAND